MTAPKPDAPRLGSVATGFRLTRRYLHDAILELDGSARRSTAATALDIVVGDLTSGGALDDASRPRRRATPW